MQSTSCELPGWMKHKVKSGLLGEIYNLRYADGTTIMAESKEELRRLLMKVKEDNEKAGLKFNIKKLRSWYPVPSLHGKQWKQWHFVFLGSKITADADCSHEIKRHLLLRRKAMTNLDNVLKSRDITLPTKFLLVKVIVFPIVMYGCESWAIRKVEHWRIDAFELWCWRRLLRIPWNVRRSS